VKERKIEIEITTIANEGMKGIEFAKENEFAKEISEKEIANEIANTTGIEIIEIEKDETKNTVQEISIMKNQREDISMADILRIRKRGMNTSIEKARIERDEVLKLFKT